MLESTSPDPIRLLLVDADVETRALIALLLCSHTGREYVVESVSYGSSEPGFGATFKVYLPVDLSDRADATPTEPVRGQWSKGRETVLLVEDAPMIRRLAREIMTRAGYTVIEAADGIQALSLAAAHEGRIEMLVTDLIMPGPSGVDLAEQLTTIRHDVRVLFMSGYTDNAIVRNGLLAEGALFLQKAVYA